MRTENDKAIGVELHSGEKFMQKKLFLMQIQDRLIFAFRTENLDTDVKSRIKHHRSKGKVAKLSLSLISNLNLLMR